VVAAALWEGRGVTHLSLSQLVDLRKLNVISVLDGQV
jgi:hypothetical protein